MMRPGMNPARFLTLFVATAVVGCASGCRREEPPPAPTAALDRLAPMENISRGARLYQEHCAQCHGPEAQGHPDWQTPGVAAAPPLNGTGNDWKRKKPELVAAIKEGIKRKGEPMHPDWKGRLNNEEIEDIITWFQALWPADVYERWRKANAPATRPKG
jgi:mono/diheme cytochrome c family protein